jgi:hypothetical protein
MAWTLQSQPVDSRELDVYKYLTTQTGNPQLARNVTQFMDLRKYIDTHNFQSASELRKNVLSDGQPLFNESQSKILFEKTKKRGGGSDSALRGLVDFFYGWTPYGFTIIAEDVITPNIYILSVLEKDPEAGPLYTVALDAVTAALPPAATAISNITADVIGAIPIPESGPVGGLIGWMVGSVLSFLVMLVHLSRRHFPEAAMLSFDLIPFVGEALYQAALAGEKFVKKTADKREDLIKTTTNLYGNEIGGIVSDLIPDLEVQTPDTFQAPPDTVQLAETLKNNIPSPMSLVPEGMPTSLDQAKQMATDHVSKLGLPTSVDQAKQMAADKVRSSIAGGKPLSSRLRSKDKWRTQRKSRL